MFIKRSLPIALAKRNIEATFKASRQTPVHQVKAHPRRELCLTSLLETDIQPPSQLFICREKQIRSIEATFEASRQPPVHQDKPHLQPEMVLPLLPDLDRFDDPFVQAIFDADPTLESERHRHYAADVREEMASRVSGGVEVTGLGCFGGDSFRATGLGMFGGVWVKVAEVTRLKMSGGDWVRVLWR
jgi:hypothetical protein